jgi:hypothetical protein
MGLDVARRHIPHESVTPAYLDPPFKEGWAAGDAVDGEGAAAREPSVRAA